MNKAKRMVVAAAVAISCSALAWTPAESNALDAVDLFVGGYATNKLFVGKWAWAIVKPPMSGNVALMQEVDMRLASNPPVNMARSAFSDILPNTVNAATDLMCRETGIHRSYLALSWDAKNEDEKMLLSLILARVDRCGICSIDRKHLQKTMLSASVKSARRKLRREGKSILPGKDGVDPCSEYVEGVRSALEAPFYCGLSNAMSRCGIDMYVPSEYRYDGFLARDIEKTKERVFFGDIEFNRMRQEYFLFVLGKKEFNIFVERYNGGSK